MTDPTLARPLTADRSAAEALSAEIVAYSDLICASCIEDWPCPNNLVAKVCRWQL